MKMSKDEIIIILVLILLEAIGLGICYVWFDKLHVFMAICINIC